MQTLPEHSQDDAFVREAIQRVLDGDVDAFAVIVNACQRLLAADLARRLPPQDVQEVAQDTFIRAFRALPSYRGEAPVKSWLLRIGRYAAMDFWRKHYRRRDRLMTDLDDSELFRMEMDRQQKIAEHQTDRDAQEQARELLHRALAQLSPDDRAVITLVELEGHTMADAARQLHCSVAAVKVRAFRARRRLKEIVEQLNLKQEETQ